MSNRTNNRKPATDRRSQLLNAAAQAFRDQGVASTSVDDIVRLAGVAKGTFYLYFDSKDDAINAVVEQMVDEVIDLFERSLGSTGATAVQRLESFGLALSQMARERHHVELAEHFHRPDNRLVHERMAERVSLRLVPLVERIIEQGMMEGLFRVHDVRLAAWCVLGAFQAVERDQPDFSALDTRVSEALSFAFRGLGYEGNL